jgi:transcription antitermination factor NusG
MNAMTGAMNMELQWYAVRLARPRNPGRRTALVGVEAETYRSRAGKVCRRPVKGTGKRVFVPELILRRAGFEVFLPVRQEWRRKNRYSPDKHLVSFPAMADWLFVGWPVGQDRWHELMDIDVVQGVAGYGGRPLRIGTGAMAKLFRTFAGGLVAPDNQKFMRSNWEYNEGDRVRVACGVLDGQEVEVIGVDGGQARVMIRFFGGSYEAMIHAGALERL